MRFPAGGARALLLAVVVTFLMPAGLVRAEERVALWSDGFESGNFRGWSAWGQYSPAQWGHVAVVHRRRTRVPPRKGRRMARFQTTRRDIRRGRYHAKIFKGFFVEDPVNGRHPPPDVSGSYRVWFYFPRRYRVPRGTWVNVLQFKEKYRFGEGERSDPFWWIEVRDARWMRQRPRRRWHGRPPRRASAPVAFVNHPRASNNVRTVHGKPIPLGRWVEFRADVHQNDRIDFSIDGELFDTGRASDSPVGPVRGSGSLEWILGIGNYSTGVNGPLYADEASYNLP